MSIPKPTATQLKEWEAILAAEGEAVIERDRLYVPLEETHGVLIPAQPSREGGIFWHKRADMFHGTWERNKVQPYKHVCIECGKNFTGRVHARMCSRRCRNTVLKRRSRARLVTLNSSGKDEE